MGAQSKAIAIFLQESQHSNFRHVNPEVSGDGDFEVSHVIRPQLGETNVGLPVYFEQKVQKVDVRGGVVHIVHPAVLADAPVLSTTWIQVAEGAHATIIEEFEGSDSAVQSGISVLTGARDAVVDYVRNIRMQQGRAGIYKCVVEALGPQVRAWQIVRGAGIADSSMNIRLLAKGANVDLMSVTLAHGDADVHNDLYTTHDAAKTHSRVMARALSFGDSRITASGRAVLPDIAKGAETAVDMKGLLLGQGSITMVPKLRINQLDVVAGHGAAIGPLDPNAVFYLNSRGIDQNQARMLLLRAFVMPLIANLPSKSIMDGVISDLDNLIGGTS